MWTAADYIKRLPDVYHKEVESNNYKLLSLEQSLVATFLWDVQCAHDALDINNATGATLDLYGDMVGVQRGSAQDDVYRYLILAAVAKQFCDGTYNAVVEQLAIALGCSKKDIEVFEGNGVVTLVRFPLAAVYESGLTAEQIKAIIQALLPAGIRLEAIEMVGTFEFSAFADEYDETAGFADDEQTIGGFFGAIYD